MLSAGKGTRRLRTIIAVYAAAHILATYTFQLFKAEEVMGCEVAQVLCLDAIALWSLADWLCQACVCLVLLVCFAEGEPAEVQVIVGSGDTLRLPLVLDDGLDTIQQWRGEGYCEAGVERTREDQVSVAERALCLCRPTLGIMLMTWPLALPSLLSTPLLLLACALFTWSSPTRAYAVGGAVCYLHLYLWLQLSYATLSRSSICQETTYTTDKETEVISLLYHPIDCPQAG